MTAPLDGIVVVSLEQAISAPFATRQLADLGATVIKVERPEGDFARHYDSVVQGESAFFVWANRGKQSVALDVKDDADLATFRALIAGADVFLHNLSPRAAERLGIDAPTLLAEHPSIIAAEISGYGHGGPRADDKAYDLAIQAEAGVFSVTGDEQMSKVGFSVADICSGMYAFSSILAALVRRERTGEGAAIQVSMLDSLAEWVSAPAVQRGVRPRPVRRARGGVIMRSRRTAPSASPTAARSSSPSSRMRSGAAWPSTSCSPPSWAPTSASPPTRAASPTSRSWSALIAECLDGIPADVARERLAVGRIATARVNDLQGVWEHEQLRARGRFVPVSTPSGTIELLASPFDISGWTPSPARVPALDEHDDATLDAVMRRGRGD